MARGGGAQVKKGELVIQLDDSALVEQLKTQKAALDAARAELTKAGDDFDLVAPVDMRKILVDAEQTRVLEIEQQIQSCRMVAPQDGMVMYVYPERAVNDSGSMVVAQGQPVREGQKLIQVVDLTQMLVNVRVPEAFVSGLRDEDPKDKNGPPPVRIRVDFYPNRVFNGHVKKVATVAEQVDIYSSDVIYYRALVSLDDQPDGLKPGMSAEVTVDTGRATGVLHVPLPAVVREGQKEYCYVNRGKEIHKSAVTPGLRTDARVEIRSGVERRRRSVALPRRFVAAAA